MFVINPDQYSLPCYRMGPFTTKDLSFNHNLPDSDLINEYFKERFKNKDITYTINGRQALHMALSHYNLVESDIVTILTTSGNFYISGCVTNEIEKYCKWSREIVPQTKLILVNHEFGYPFTDWLEIKEYGLPVIEDCAYSFFSTDEQNRIGNVGDFVIYSFPKMFPLQIGGLLVSNIDRTFKNDIHIKNKDERYVKNVLSFYIPNKDSIIRNRISNYDYLKDKFYSLGFSERFHLHKGVIPGVFMFRTEAKKIDLPKLKKYFWAHGIQCSVFYREEAFFIPCHQNLLLDDLNYFFEVLNSTL